MASILTTSKDITTLDQAQKKLGLTLSEEPHFFDEWLADLPNLIAVEQARIGQIRQNYLHQVSSGLLLEETVKMVTLSP